MTYDPRKRYALCDKYHKQMVLEFLSADLTALNTFYIYADSHGDEPKDCVRYGIGFRDLVDLRREAALKASVSTTFSLGEARREARQQDSWLYLIDLRFRS